MSNWDAVITEHGPTVWRVCWRLLADRSAVEDAFQDTFVAAIQFAQNSSVQNWEALLVQFATRRAMDRLRSRYRHRRTIDHTTDFDLAVDITASSSAGPHDTAVATELSERLCAALTQIPAQQAEVFALAALEGWSNEDIASHLGMTTNAVRVDLHRARERLRELLNE